MSSKRYLLTAVIAGFLAGGATASSGAADPQAVERASTVSTTLPKPAPQGCKLYAAPALVPGKSAWVTVEDAEGRPQANVSVLVDDVAHDTNGQGEVSFVVPKSGVLSLSLVSDTKHLFETKQYALVPRGLLVSLDWAPVVQKLLQSYPPVTVGPTIWLSPIVVEPNQFASIIGTNFDAAVGAEKISIDGMQSHVLSASPASLFFQASKSQSIGPVKELFAVSKGGESSNVVEVDVASAVLAFDKDSAKPDQTINARLSVVGTNLPSLVEFSNATPDACLVQDSNGKRVPDHTLLVSPGGEANSISLKLTINRPERMNLGTHVIADAITTAEMSKDPVFLRNSCSLQDLNRAQLVKLRRRLIAIESRIAEQRKSRDSVEKSASPVELEKLSAELRALSVRQIALSSMIASQKIYYMAAGATPEDVRLAEDDAAGGAYYGVDKSIQAINVISENSSASATRNAHIENMMPPPPMRVANLLAEPRIKLWTPIGLDVLDAAAVNAVLHAPLPGSQPSFSARPNSDLQAPGKTEAGKTEAGKTDARKLDVTKSGKGSKHSHEELHPQKKSSKKSVTARKVSHKKSSLSGSSRAAVVKTNSRRQHQRH